MLLNFNKHNTIKSVGSYFDLDEDGYLINPASTDKIQEKWLPIIEDVISIYKKKYSDRLVCVYLRGSVARGQAIEEVSDIDTFALLKEEHEKDNQHWITDFEQDLMNKYLFLNGAEFLVRPIGKLNNINILMQQSVCVYGQPVEYTKLKPGKDLIIHMPHLLNDIKQSHGYLINEYEPEEIQDICQWLMKRFLRSGFELCMERENTYTRDLFPCYETFSKYYPDKEADMKEVLHLALNPTRDKWELVKVINDFGDWLSCEIDAQINAMKE